METYFNQLPQSYATLLGEEGINISGGQKQLVALARVLWRNPALLLLDEPTAAMDRNMENFVLFLLNKLKVNTGIFLITHRLKIAKGADTICILENGKTQQSGTHNELIEKENLYSAMFNEMLGA